MSRTYQHLSPEERAVIMIERQNGSSLRTIGLRLGRSAATVSRELRRCDQDAYNASQAALSYRRRRSRCRPMIARTVLLGALLCTAPVFAASSTTPLQHEAQRLVAMLPGEVGVSMLHLQSGRAVHVNADRAFPLASVMKVPVAVHIPFHVHLFLPQYPFPPGCVVVRNR